MNQLLDRITHVAKKPAPAPIPTDEPRNRIDLRADPEWIERVQEHADKVEITLTAYIRQAVSERMERDDAARKKLFAE